MSRKINLYKVNHLRARILHIHSLVFFLVTVLCDGVAVAQTTCDRVREYIEKHKELAIEQMVIHKIPASVTMAQAIKESGCGNSELAKNTNNHFGIKCHKEWGGQSITKDDDTLNECFRSYRSVSDSYLDHSLFLRSRPRYSSLFNLKPTDYFGWCIGLKNAGYATASNYTQELLFLIEVYDLAKLDECAPLALNSCAHLLMNASERNIIENLPKLNIESIEKPILAKLIFNVYKEEEPLLVKNSATVKIAER